MKRIYTYTMMVLLTAMSATFTSCETTDTDMAMALSGQWQGDFGMYYNYEDRGRVYTFDSYDTDIVFYPEYRYARYGWGKQVDYYEYGPYEYQYYKFYWEIVDGEIFLTYPYAPELNTSVMDYHLTNSYFSGWFTNADTRFVLHKLVDFYDWGPYTNDYSYGARGGWYDYYDDPYYYAPTRSDGETETVSTSEGKIVKRGNRYSETK